MPGATFVTINNTPISPWSGNIDAAGFSIANLAGITGSDLKLTKGSSPMIYTSDNFPLRLGTNGFERVRIDTAGNVGIGTSTPAGPISLGNPASDANVRTWANSDQGNIAFYQAQNFPTTNAFRRVLDIMSGGSNAGGYIRFLTQAASAAGAAAIVIDPAGGISVPLLPSSNPGAGTKQLWYDPADGNRVKFAA